VVEFGAAKPHCAYLFANRRANRIEVLVHDGLGIWLAARRLSKGKVLLAWRTSGPRSRARRRTTSSAGV